MSKNDKFTSKKKGTEPVASKHMTPGAIQYRIEYFMEQIKKKKEEREEVKAEIKKANVILIDYNHKLDAAAEEKSPTANIESSINEVQKSIDALQNRYTIISTRIYALRVGMKRWIRVKAEREMELGIAPVPEDKVGATS